MQKVIGEIYDVDDAFLEWLDNFEGHPDMYVREEIKINVDSLISDAESTHAIELQGWQQCWVYFMKNFPQQYLSLETYESYDAYGDHNKTYYSE